MSFPTVTEGDRAILPGCIVILGFLAVIAALVLLFPSVLRTFGLLPSPPPPAEQDAPAPPPPAEQDAPAPLPSTAAPIPPAPITPPIDPPPAPVPTPPPVLPDPAPAPELPAPPTPVPTDAAPPPSPANPASPPAPHFRNIRWDMSPDEVRAAEAPLSPLRSTDSSITFAATTLDRPCLLSYAFRNGRLTAARLQFSLPSSSHVPALSPVAAHAACLWLRAQLDARYGPPSSETHASRPRDTSSLADRARQAREDAATYAATLAAARQRLADRTAQLQTKYRSWPEAAARIDRELASEHRYIALLEAWIAETRSAEQNALSAIDQSHLDDATLPLLARDTLTWSSTNHPHTVTLSANYTTIPARLEIRYHSNLPPPDAATGL